jgi:hypothetical protein
VPSAAPDLGELLADAIDCLAEGFGIELLTH